jgi:hypothetical protein
LQALRLLVLLSYHSAVDLAEDAQPLLCITSTQASRLLLNQQ